MHQKGHHRLLAGPLHRVDVLMHGNVHGRPGKPRVS